MTTPEAAAFLTISKSFLDKFRVRGGGPKFVRVGRHVRYSIYELQEWLDDQTCGSTSSYAGRR